MPIRPELAPLYPPDWPQISQRIRFERAGGRCEGCGRPHGRLVFCLPDGRWLDPAATRTDDMERSASVGAAQSLAEGPAAWTDRLGLPTLPPGVDDLVGLRLTRVVTATAHLDHDPTNNADANLRALCQRCHMIHDRTHHRTQRWRRWRLRLAVADLFGRDGWWRRRVARINQTRIPQQSVNRVDMAQCSRQGTLTEHGSSARPAVASAMAKPHSWQTTTHRPQRAAGHGSSTRHAFMASSATSMATPWG